MEPIKIDYHIYTAARSKKKKTIRPNCISLLYLYYTLSFIVSSYNFFLYQKLINYCIKASAIVHEIGIELYKYVI